MPTELSVPSKILESLAAIEHERWAHWQRYLHEKCAPQADGSLLIPAELVKHWERQIEKTYSQLTEQEKQSDRDQVMRYWPIVAAAFDKTKE